MESLVSRFDELESFVNKSLQDKFENLDGGRRKFGNSPSMSRELN